MSDYKNSFYAKSKAEWRSWLSKNHDKEKAVWLIIYKKESKVPSIYYSEAVDEALCFGWVDSKPNKKDENSYYQYFAPRNPKSNWSKVNKEKVARLVREGRMHKSGYALIEAAKANGSWIALDNVEQLLIPQDLLEALKKAPNAMLYFDKFPKSSKKNILEWILNAKKEETRKKRIKETAQKAGKNIRANHYRQPKKR